MTRKLLVQTILTFLALTAVAISVNLLAINYNIVSGGLTGYGLLINQLLDFPTGVSLLAFNLIILILGLLILGKGPGIKGIIGFTYASLSIDFFGLIVGSEVDETSFLSKLVLITLLTIVMVVAMSVILHSDYNFGGYSTLYLLAKKYYSKVQPQTVFFLLDFTLAVISLVLINSEVSVLILYNSIVAYLLMKAIFPQVGKFIPYTK